MSLGPRAAQPPPPLPASRSAEACEAAAAHSLCQRQHAIPMARCGPRGQIECFLIAFQFNSRCYSHCRRLHKVLSPARTTGCCRFQASIRWVGQMGQEHTAAAGGDTRECHLMWQRRLFGGRERFKRGDTRADNEVMGSGIDSRVARGKLREAAKVFSTSIPLRLSQIMGAGQAAAGRWHAFD